MNLQPKAKIERRTDNDYYRLDAEAPLVSTKARPVFQVLCPTRRICSVSVNLLSPRPSLTLVAVQSTTSADSNPLDWLFRTKSGSLADRVLARLIQCEAHEANPHFKDDYRIAWVTAYWCANGIPEWSWYSNFSPYEAATYQVLRCHPDQVWPRLVALRQQKLGIEYELLYDADGNSRAHTSKPSSPATSERERKTA